VHARTTFSTSYCQPDLQREWKEEVSPNCTVNIGEKKVGLSFALSTQSLMQVIVLGVNCSEAFHSGEMSGKDGSLVIKEKVMHAKQPTHFEWRILSLKTGEWKGRGGFCSRLTSSSLE